jgi:hypothetical protein
MAIPHDITADIGTSVQRLFKWSRKIPPTNALARVDLTGATAVMKVCKKAGSDPIFNLTQVDGISLGGNAGTILVQITGGMWPSTRPAPGNYVYDLVVTLANTTVVKLVEGRFTVRETISV